MAMVTGGPAFPSSGLYPGMTLRDWFAGQALRGLLADGVSGYGDRSKTTVEELSIAAYQRADAMLEARTGGRHRRSYNDLSPGELNDLQE